MQQGSSTSNAQVHMMK